MTDIYAGGKKNYDKNVEYKVKSPKEQVMPEATSHHVSGASHSYGDRDHKPR